MLKILKIECVRYLKYDIYVKQYKELKMNTFKIKLCSFI